MRTAETAIQNKVTLRPLNVTDVTARYLAWFSDKHVIRYLDVCSPTKEECIAYIKRSKAIGNFLLYAVCVDGVHIGNLKIGPTDRKHGLSDLVTVIGDSDYWGKGYATEAIKQGIEIAFAMGIRKIAAGIYLDNIGSIIAYIRAGFHIEAVLRDQYVSNGKLQDRICVCAFNPACE